MRGYQVIFFTLQSERHGRQALCDWLLREARNLGVPGATMNMGQAGYGQDGQFHSAHFFELSEQPVEVLMVLTEEECDAFFYRLEEEGIKVFYSKTPVEFGRTGEA